jgi:hypothetical protein
MTDSTTSQPNTTTSQPVTITSLTDGLKGLQQSGPADLKLSTETRDAYVNLIGAYHATLKTARDQMNGLENLDNLGSLSSAKQTAQNLKLDVTDLTGIQHAVDKYLAYLDELEKTVKSAADRLVQTG